MHVDRLYYMHSWGEYDGNTIMNGNLKIDVVLEVPHTGGKIILTWSFFCHGFLVFRTPPPTLESMTPLPWSLMVIPLPLNNCLLSHLLATFPEASWKIQHTQEKMFTKIHEVWWKLVEITWTFRVTPFSCQQFKNLPSLGRKTKMKIETP